MRDLGGSGEPRHRLPLHFYDGKLMARFFIEVMTFVGFGLLFGTILGGLGVTLAEKGTYRNRVGFRGFLGTPQI